MPTKTIECHLAQGQIGRYLNGERFSAQAVKLLEEHLADCDQCSELVTRRRQLLLEMLGDANLGVGVVRPMTASAEGQSATLAQEAKSSFQVPFSAAAKFLAVISVVAALVLCGAYILRGNPGTSIASSVHSGALKKTTHEPAAQSTSNRETLQALGEFNTLVAAASSHMRFKLLTKHTHATVHRQKTRIPVSSAASISHWSKPIIRIYPPALEIEEGTIKVYDAKGHAL